MPRKCAVIVESGSRRALELEQIHKTHTGKTVTNSENTAIAFSITRLNCSKGIFKLSGYWQANHADYSKIDVQQLHMMASDGWEELNLHADNTQSLVQTLLPEVREHLASRHKP